MGKSLVGLGHLVGIVPLFAGAADIVDGVHDLTGETVLHGTLRTLTGVAGEPSQAQGLTSLRTHFHRNLIGSATDTAGFYLQLRHDIFHGLLKAFQGIFTGLFSDNGKGVIYDLLRNTHLAVIHDVVDQACYEFGIIKRDRQDVTLCDITSSWHFASLLHIL